MNQKFETPLKVVGIGASAGGLDALTEFFSNIPKKSGFTFVVIQHLDPSHQSLLAEILSKQTGLRASEAKNHGELHPDCIYIIPPNMLISITRKRIKLEPRVGDGGLFMPIDYFFLSLAREYGENAIAILLSGGGSDGTIGLQKVKDDGGTTFAQDEVSAKYPSMPHSAIETGAVDYVLSPTEIAHTLRRIGEKLEPSASPLKEIQKTFERDSDDLKNVIRLVQKSAGIDFSSYKFPTLSRRLSRRMALHRIKSIKEYEELLKTNSEEARTLAQDLLIQVTRFFRDPEVFEYLKKEIYPKIVQRPLQSTIRIWVPGCASGEEAYSILISLLEYMEDNKVNFAIQMFATDISESAITKARAGLYSKDISADVGPERIRRFFSVQDDKYAIKKTIRDMCIFAVHNLLTDPPFAQLDLITCRNVLIYIEPEQQKRVLSIFHYALKPHATLLLGSAESARTLDNLYEQRDSHQHAYSKKQQASRLYFDLASAHHVSERVSPVVDYTHTTEGEITKGTSIQREVDRLLLARFVPAGVVVDDRLQVVQFRGKTGPFFEHAPGQATLDLLSMLREGLVAEVRKLIESAKKHDKPARSEGLQVRVDSHVHRIAVEAFPVTKSIKNGRFFVVLFEDMETPDYQAAQQRRARHAAVEEAPLTGDSAALRAELASTKEFLQSVNEEKEAANEELRAANEEIMSSNEELQSTNEELHTAKEELQSTNEELLVVNDELKSRNDELSQANNDLNNLLTSVSIAVIILDRKLRIRKFTPTAERLLRLIPSDAGRSFSDIKPTVDIPELDRILLEVVDTGTSRDLEAKDNTGKWHQVQIRPYRTNDGRIDGTILLFIDINQLKESIAYSEAIEETIGHPLLILTGDLKVKRANRKYYETFRTSPVDTEGRFLYRLGNDQWDIPKLRELLEEVLPKKSRFEDFKVKHNFAGLGERTLRLSARRLFFESKETETILLSIAI